MKTWLLKLTACAILLMCALTTNAQYRKLTRGQPMPYDTGVAIEITQYRAEGKFIKKTRIAIDSLNLEAKTLTREIDSLYREIDFKESLFQNQRQQTEVLSERYVTLSESVNKLSGLFDQLHAVNRKPWYLKALITGGKVIVICFAGYGAVSLIIQ